LLSVFGATSRIVSLQIGEGNRCLCGKPCPSALALIWLCCVGRSEIRISISYW